MNGRDVLRLTQYARRGGLRPGLGLGLWLGLIVAVVPVRAQDQAGVHDTEAARALFRAGVLYFDAGRWPEAADRFQRSLGLKPSPVVSYNLATALVQMNQLVEAVEVLQGVLRETEPTSDVHQLSRKLLATVEPRLGRVSVALSGAVDDSVWVQVGHRLHSVRELRHAQPVNPGRLTITTFRRGEPVGREEVEILEGGVHPIALPVPEGPVPSALDAAQTARPNEHQHLRRDGPETRRQPAATSPWLWAGLGAGVVAAIVVGIVVVNSGGGSGGDDAGAAAVSF